MFVRYRDARAERLDGGSTIHLTCRIENHSAGTWSARAGFSIGWQIYDPETGIFISEGDWIPLERDVAAGEGVAVRLDLALPPESGKYRVYVSPMDPEAGWLYTVGEPLLVVDAEVENGEARVIETRTATVRQLRWANLGPALRRVVTEPFGVLAANRQLIGSMVRREILARYRGSFGDAAWTILHPLLLMVTYFFVFGVVLQSRFGNDPSKTSFALYFLAGMLPWLAFSEPVGRAAYVILENRNFVKKMVFPTAILPVNQVIAGLVTSLFATALFLAALVIVRGGVPWTASLLPVLLIPQVLFTLGVCWFLAALGAYLRDLSQVMTFVLTLWFFVTPICYPETSLPAALVPVLGKNPMFHLVRGYRQIFLEGLVPEWHVLWKLWVVAGLAFFGGQAWFSRLKRTFADIV